MFTGAVCVSVMQGAWRTFLQTYDRERRVLPPPVRLWEWGWTKSAETWNGRIASARPPAVLWSLWPLFVWDKAAVPSSHGIKTGVCKGLVLFGGGWWGGGGRAQKLGCGMV